MAKPSRFETPKSLVEGESEVHLAVGKLRQLREKREELNKSIAADEEEKGAHRPSRKLCRSSADMRASPASSPRTSPCH